LKLNSNRFSSKKSKSLIDNTKVSARSLTKKHTGHKKNRTRFFGLILVISGVFVLLIFYLNLYHPSDIYSKSVQSATQSSATQSTSALPSTTSTNLLKPILNPAVISQNCWELSKSVDNSSVITGISCPEINVCIAVGVAGSSGYVNFKGYSAIAYTSSDGGKTWNMATLPSSIEGLTSVTCSSASSCIAVGEGQNSNNGAVISSADGGKSWKNITPTGIGKLSDINCDNTGYCMAVEETQDGQSSAIISSNGSNWTTASTRLLSPVVSSCINCSSINSVVNANIQSVSCISTNNCIVVGNIYSSQVGNSKVGFISYTTNGGTSWSESTIPPSIQTLTSVSCQNLGKCIASGITDSSNKLQLGSPVMLISLDAGITWKFLSYINNVNTLTDLKCFNNTCLATGIQFEVSNPTSPDNTLNVTQSEVLESLDGGVSWHSIASVESGNELLSIACETADTCIAGGTEDNYEKGILIYGSI
jgi:photosystem II stability/assembly factor-like uncharacterized protein